MKRQRTVLDVTPSFWRPLDYEWVLWPLIEVQRHVGPGELCLVRAFRLLFLRVQWITGYSITPAEQEALEHEQKARATRLEALAGQGTLHEFVVSCTPAPFDAADRRWYLWPLMVRRTMRNGMRPMTRNGRRVWHDDGLVFQCLCFRLRFVLRGELSARAIARAQLLEHLPDIGDAAPEA